MRVREARLIHANRISPFFQESFSTVLIETKENRQKLFRTLNIEINGFREKLLLKSTEMPNGCEIPSFFSCQIPAIPRI